MTSDTTNAKLQFASDNASPICPEAWEALERANFSPESTFAVPYGDDPITAEATRNVPVRMEERKRFAISDDEMLELARYAVAIEQHYSALAGKPRPMDIEWARDGESGELFIVQARPETVHSIRTDAYLVGLDGFLGNEGQLPFRFPFKTRE